MERTESREPSERPRSAPVSLIDSDLSLTRDDTVDEGDLYVDADPAEIINRAQRLRTGSISPGSQTPTLHGTLEKEASENPEKLLTDNLNALTIREAKLRKIGQLPFLRRNLRNSMDALGPSKWRGHDPGAVRTIDIAQVSVMYILAGREYTGGSFYGRWFCPLCSIKLCFNTRGALDTHLYRYHTRCAYEWSDSEDVRVVS